MSVFHSTASVQSPVSLFLGLRLALEPLPAQSFQSDQAQAKVEGTHQTKEFGGIIGSVRDRQEAAVVGVQVKLSDP